MTWHAGLKYVMWEYYVEPHATPAEKVIAYERFAKEFDEMPLDYVPSEQWLRDMADGCRRLAQIHRDEGVAGRGSGGPTR